MDEMQPIMSAAPPLLQNETVAIVILNYNTRPHLALYLPSVVAHSAGARIVVADNGSPDDSVAWLRTHYPQVEVLELPKNYGFAQGYNEALRQVEADIYVLLNSDVEVTAGWLHPLLTFMQANPRVGVCQPRILSWNNRQCFEHAGAAGGWIDFLGYPFCRGRIFTHVEQDTNQYADAQPCFWATGAAFFIRSSLYHALGGFDGDYFAHNEEIDLCWRIQRAGYEVWCVPESIVYHLGGGTLEYENPRKVFLNFRNSLYSIVKNQSVQTLWWLIPTRLILDGVAAARFAAKGQFRAIWAILEAHFSFYRNGGRTWAKRRASRQFIERMRIGPPRLQGVYRKSIVLAYYWKRRKTFSQLDK